MSGRRATTWLALALALLAACGGEEPSSVPVPGHEGRFKTAALARAERRMYDGAPPVIPHRPFSGQCVVCHTTDGIEVEGVGFAPPMPHEDTGGLSATSRCTQCHVFQRTDELFVASTFEGVPQDLRRGDRLHAFAPPVIPHRVFMRENCAACHTGPAAREEIRTTHPDRARCTQCHVEQTARDVFERP